MRQTARKRQGNVLVLVAFFLVGLVAVVAYAVDYGYLLVLRTDLQRAADAAALAAVRDLEPDALGDQTGAEEAARATARQYANLNIRSSESSLSSLTIPDEDIVVGRYDRATINSGTVTFQEDPTSLDAVRVTLRRDGTTNPGVPLFFGRLLGVTSTNLEVTAIAVLRPARGLTPGVGVLPIAADEDHWNSMGLGAEFTIYGDGQVTNGAGDIVNGNWGTVDIGSANNSTSDMREQIEEGLRQDDLDFMYEDYRPNGERRIPTNTEIPPNVWVNGDPGLSAGLKSAVANVIGQTKAIPIVSEVAGGDGNNSEFHVVRWGIVEVMAVQMHGSHNSYIRVQKRLVYDATLRPISDLSNEVDIVEGGLAAAGLVE